MKTPSDKLFNLIKSLDKHEKRYFKIHSLNKRGPSGYIKLFDAIDRQTVYDENKLKQKFRAEPFIKNFKIIKSYLFEALLRSLSDYHQDISIDSELRRLLQQAEVLDKKKLTEMALRVLSKAEKIATEQEKFEYLLLVLSLKVGVIRKLQSDDQIGVYLENDVQKEHNSIRSIINVLDFRGLTLRAELVRFSRSSGFKKKNQNEMDSVFRSPLLLSPGKAITFSSLRYYYYLHFLYSSYTAKWNDEAHRKQAEWVDYLEKHPAKLAIRAENYLAALSRLMVTQFNCNRTVETETVFNKGKNFYISLPAKLQNKTLLSLFTSLTSNYLASRIVLAEPLTAITAWESVRKIIAPVELNINSALIFNANLYHCYFLLGRYREALRFLNKNINVKVNTRLDIQKEARMFALILHFELGNYELLPGLSRSSLRWISKNTSLEHFEKLFIDFFKIDFSVINNREVQMNEFKQLRRKLKLLVNKSQYWSASYYFSWLDSRIQGRPFIDILSKSGYFNKVS